MAGNIQQVSFVNPLDPGGAAALAVQQQQIQRQQALAQALQQSSFKEDKVDPGSRVSWTQGLARLADALVAKKIYKNTGDQQVGLATKQGEMMGRMFGIGGKPIADNSTTTDLAPDDVSSGTPADNVSNTAAPQDVVAPGGQPGFAAKMGAALSGATDPAPSPPVAPPALSLPAGGASYPMSLSGNPMQDYTDYAMDPESYTKALVASHSPVDMAKTVAQARAAMERGDMATASALIANVQKNNYIAPVSVRQGGVALDPVTHQPIFQAAQAPEGSQVNYGSDGKAASITPIAGGAAAIQAEHSAKAVGGAAADFVDVYNPATQSMVKVPKTALLSNAANGGAPMASGAPLGAQAAANVTGTNSANAFQDISNGAADVPNRIYALHQMQMLANDPKSQFGAGSAGINHFNSLLGTLSHSTGIKDFNPQAATNANEFQKWATQYSARSGQELGLSGSDARTQLAVHATPNGEMTREALKSVIPQMIGIENAKQGYAQAANAWQQQHGPQTVQQFRTEWNRVYDPSIYTHMAQGPQAFAGWVKGLKPAEAAQVRSKYLALKQIGALGQ